MRFRRIVLPATADPRFGAVTVGDRADELDHVPDDLPLASGVLGRAAEGSGVIATAIVDGAIIPPPIGRLVDAFGLHAALALPAPCYVVIVGRGLDARPPASVRDAAVLG